jgi:uncharacterized membrane protein
MNEPTSGTVPPKQTSGAETIGASAVGGAAIGSVVGIAAALGSVVVPVLGTAVGAIGGAAVGWLVRRMAQKKQLSSPPGE